jgi:hypothetical protein
LALKRRKPRPPRPEKRPPRHVGPDAGLFDHPPQRDADEDLWKVRDELVRLNLPDYLPNVIRETFDQIYDGQRTGRWDFDQLNKTEKTHVGTLLQINLQKELDLSDGDDLDYLVAGVEVDCKWSQTMYGWEIPEEMYNRSPRLALLIWGNDYTGRWAAGLLRIDESALKPLGGQRDRKRKINDEGKRRILWLKVGDLVRNTLLDLPDTQRDRILSAPSGQKCVNELFRELTGVLVNRATILTAAQQDDSLKRVRDARKNLRTEGIVIFGHYHPHPNLAESLGLPRPTRGRFVSTRLAPTDAEEPEGTIELDGRLWCRAHHDAVETEAPLLPRQGKESD